MSPLNIIQVWLDGYRNLSNFDGRARRRDFAAFMAVQTVIFWGLAIVFSRLFGEAGAFLLVLMLFWYIFTGLAFNVRRLHDAGLAGWVCIFYFGFYAFIIMGSLFMPPSPKEGDNAYGPNPRAAKTPDIPPGTSV